MFSRRAFVLNAAASSMVATAAEPPRAGSTTTALKSMTGDVKPIAAEERRARIVKVRSLMAQHKVAALIVEPGSTLEYFTGIRWHRSERTTVAIIPRQGEILVVTPAFKEPSVRETLQVGADVRIWNEHESPFKRMVQ